MLFSFVYGVEGRSDGKIDAFPAIGLSFLSRECSKAGFNYGF